MHHPALLARQAPGGGLGRPAVKVAPELAVRLALLGPLGNLILLVPAPAEAPVGLLEALVRQPFFPKFLDVVVAPGRATFCILAGSNPEALYVNAKVRFFNLSKGALYKNHIIQFNFHLP